MFQLCYTILYFFNKGAVFATELTLLCFQFFDAFIKQFQAFSAIDIPLL